MALIRWSVGRLFVSTFSRRMNQRVATYSTQEEEDFGQRLTGVERRERDARMQNITDPFSLEIPEYTGTKDSPMMVPSMFDERIVGCLCNRNHHGAYWFMLKKGVTQRCLCGGYFQLTEGPAAKVY